MMIRFDELREENPDIVAWIRSDDPENTGIDYPVFYSGDNEKYLRRDLYGKSHIAGSIFLEGLNRPDFTDYYTVIYGHNMNDGSMFGGLKKYRKKEFWEEKGQYTGIRSLPATKRKTAGMSIRSDMNRGRNIRS